MTVIGTGEQPGHWNWQAWRRDGVGTCSFRENIILIRDVDERYRSVSLVFYDHVDK